MLLKRRQNLEISADISMTSLDGCYLTYNWLWDFNIQRHIFLVNWTPFVTAQKLCIHVYTKQIKTQRQIVIYTCSLLTMMSSICMQLQYQRDEGHQ